MTTKSLTLEMPKAEAARVDAALKECLAEMERARKRMKSDLVEIDRLKAQTRALLAQMKAA